MPAEASEPPPDPGQMKLGDRPVARLDMKERNQSSPLLAVESDTFTGEKVSSGAQLIADTDHALHIQSFF